MLSPLSAEEGNQEASHATGSLLFPSVPPQPPCKDHPVICLMATFSSMQTQTEAFKVTRWLIFLEASVSSGFWQIKWLKKFSPGAHCEMPRGVRFCFVFQAQMPLPEWLNRITLFQFWEHWSGDRRAKSPLQESINLYLLAAKHHKPKCSEKTTALLKTYQAQRELLMSPLSRSMQSPAQSWSACPCEGAWSWELVLCTALPACRRGTEPRMFI